MNEPDIQTFQAPTVGAALSRVRRAFGPDAVILQTRQLVRRGVIGEKIVGIEVTAANGPVPRRQARTANRPAPPLDEEPVPAITPSASSDPPVAEPTAPLDVNPAPDVTRGRRGRPGTAAPRAQLDAEPVPDAMGSVSSNRAAPEPSAPPVVKGPWTPAGQGPCADWDDLFEQLTRLELPAADVRYCLDVAQRRLGQPRPLDDPQMAELLTSLLAERILTAPIPSKSVMALVGPAGSGKTTTAVKIAAQARLTAQQSVALVTTDTYRVGATEQLRILAEILGIPMAVADTPGRLRAAVDRFAAMDLVLIDTSHRAVESAWWPAELAEILDGRIEVHLVLGANMRPASLRWALQAFNEVRYRRLILTKLDELPVKGAVAEIVALSATPISFVSSGPNIPGDLEPADSRRLARLVFGYADEPVLERAAA